MISPITYSIRSIYLRRHSDQEPKCHYTGIAPHEGNRNSQNTIGKAGPKKYNLPAEDIREIAEYCRASEHAEQKDGLRSLGKDSPVTDEIQLSPKNVNII